MLFILYAFPDNKSKFKQFPYTNLVLSFHNGERKLPYGLALLVEIGISGGFALGNTPLRIVGQTVIKGATKLPGILSLKIKDKPYNFSIKALSSILLPKYNFPNAYRLNFEVLPFEDREELIVNKRIILDEEGSIHSLLDSMGWLDDVKNVERAFFNAEGGFFLKK